MPMVYRITIAVLAINALALDSPSQAAAPDDIQIAEYAQMAGPFADCTHIEFGGGLEVLTAGARLFWREGPTAKFRESPLNGLEDAHSVAWHSGERLFYVCDSANHRLATFEDPRRDESSAVANGLAGVPLDRPHDIVYDAATGWLYALNPNRATAFRFRGFGREESSLDLSEHLGYSRALSLFDGKLYVVGSSAGKVVEVEDFDSGKFHVYTSFGKRRDAPAGSWKTTGLVLNDADFYQGYWYVTSYFCPTYAAGENCEENKFIRFETWRDFETGAWQDLSSLLPEEIVPYYLTPQDDGLCLAAFYHEPEGPPGKIFRITSRKK